MSTTIEIAGKPYNLAKALPLTLGDWEDMETAGLMQGSDLKLEGGKAMVDFLCILLHKIDPDVKRDSVRAVPLQSMIDLSEKLAGMLQNELGANPTTAPATPTSSD